MSLLVRCGRTILISDMARLNWVLRAPETIRTKVECANHRSPPNDRAHHKKNRTNRQQNDPDGFIPLSNITSPPRRDRPQRCSAMVILIVLFPEPATLCNQKMFWSVFEKIQSAISSRTSARVSARQEECSYESV